jgi:hypothetical protein
MVRVVFQSWLKDDPDRQRTQTNVVEMPVVPRAGEYVALKGSETVTGLVHIVERVTYLTLNDILGSVIVELRPDVDGDKELERLPPEDKVVP